MIIQKRWTTAIFTSSAISCVAFPAQAEDSAELAKKALNPVAAMYSLPVQYNWDQRIGPTENGMHSVTNIQPVLPITLNEDWNLISRTILPIIDQHGLAPNGAADKSGVGDITQSFFFSPKEPTESGWILGAGPALLIPTGSDELLSSEQWGLGPTAVALKQANGWTRGVLANHIWGLEGSPANDKEKINLTFLQPFLSYTNASFTTFGVNSESTYNWQSREWSVPVNVMVTQLLKLRGQPMTIQAGPRYWLDSAENGPQGWGFRVAVTLLFPK
ncbi:transporter [Pseudomonas sp.]|uniref:transporter n=1 Tax=Pseudomonas sp. TaxID=306 RepID=UPI003D0E5440